MQGGAPCKKRKTNSCELSCDPYRKTCSYLCLPSKVFQVKVMTKQSVVHSLLNNFAAMNLRICRQIRDAVFKKILQQQTFSGSRAYRHGCLKCAACGAQSQFFIAQRKPFSSTKHLNVMPATFPSRFIYILERKYVQPKPFMCLLFINCIMLSVSLLECCALQLFAKLQRK